MNRRPVDAISRRDRSARRRFTILSTAIVLMTVGGIIPRPHDSTRAEMRPHIPSPAEIKARESATSSGLRKTTEERAQTSQSKSKTTRSQIQGRKKNETRPVVRAFPVREFLAYLEYQDAQLEELSRSEEPLYDGVVLTRLRKRIAAVMPSGYYRFDRACALRYDPAQQEADAKFVELEIVCLPERHQRAYRIRLYRGNTLRGTRFVSFELLRGLTTARDFVGELRLVEGDLREGFAPEWRWQGEAALPYANAMLDALRARYPRESEAQLLAPATLRENTATLLGRFAGLAADTAYVAHRDPVVDFLAVYRAGTWIHFGRSCPLVLMETLRRETGTGLYRLQLGVDCLPAAPGLQSIQLLLPAETIAESGDAAALVDLAAGDRINAVLKFSGISAENTPAGLQFLPVWDTIKEIRPDLPLTRMEK